MANNLNHFDSLGCVYFSIFWLFCSSSGQGDFPFSLSSQLHVAGLLPHVFALQSFLVRKLDAKFDGM
jgi:hypothetical protein